MASAPSKVSVNMFTGGLITDAHPLNTPENATRDEDNCDLDRAGFRRRRLGLKVAEGSNGDYPGDSAEADIDLFYIKAHKWKNVAEDSELSFIVVQWGPTIFFFDSSYDAILDGQKSFSVDLGSYVAPGFSEEEAGKRAVAVASGKGVLFVVGEAIEPFYITYDPIADSISITDITIRVRDLEKQDTTTDIESRPTSLSNSLKYDLFNQGWGYNKVVGNDSVRYGATVTQDQVAIDYYFFATDHYPPRTKPWWVGKRSAIDPGEAGFEVFDPNGVYDTVYAGSTLAPLGHYVLEYFRKDRSTASGIPDIAIEVDDTRPTAVEFYAGRVWYGHKSTVLFSQLITDDLSVVGDCHQEADPTAEEISDLIATDGGEIFVPTSGQVVRMIAKDNSLLCFYSNGVWAIGGSTPGDGFSATGHSVKKITSVGALSPRTIFNFEGTPTWWSEEGIYILADGQGPDAYQVQNILEGKIQTFYDQLSPIAKINATGAYDKIRKRLVWLFNSTADIDTQTGRFYYNRALNFDLKYGAFFPYTFATSTHDPAAKLLDVFNKQVKVISSSLEDVVDNSSVVVTESGLTNVQVINYVFEASAAPSTDVKFLVRVPICLA